MNFKELAENLGLEETEFFELLGLFIKTSTSHLADLGKAIETGDLDGVIKSSHTIKGAAGNLGLQDIYTLAKEIEMNARQGSLSGSDEAAKLMKDKLLFLQLKLNQQIDKKL